MPLLSRFNSISSSSPEGGGDNEGSDDKSDEESSSAIVGRMRNALDAVAMRLEVGCVGVESRGAADGGCGNGEEEYDVPHD